MRAPSSWIEQFPVFEGLRPEALTFLEERLDSRRVAAGEIVIAEGELGDDLFILESGSVDVIRDLGGPKQRHFAVLRAPDVFGEMSIIECQARSATVRTREETRLHVLLSSDLYDLFCDWPDQYAVLLHRLARVLARRLRASLMESLS